MVVETVALLIIALLPGYVGGLCTTVPLSRWQLAPQGDVHDGSSGSHQAAVPGTVFNSLIQDGDVPDPFFGLNLKAVDPKQFNVPWEYSTFVETSLLKDRRVFIELDGVNYRARAYLNGVALPNLVDNATELVGTFRKFVLRVPDSAKQGTHNDTHASLNITVERPIDNWSPPGNNSTDLAISFMDWNPAPPDSSMGLWREARLVSCQQSEILLQLANPVVTSKVDTVQNSAEVTVSIDVVNLLGGEAADSEVVCDVSNADGHVMQVRAATKRIVNTTLTFESFTLTGGKLQLWWPWHMLADRGGAGAPPLYGLNCSVTSTGKTTPVLLGNRLSTKFGVREITANLTNNEYLQFYVNGARLLVLGGGYTPRLDLQVGSHSRELLFLLTRSKVISYFIIPYHVLGRFFREATLSENSTW